MLRPTLLSKAVFLTAPRCPRLCRCALKSRMLPCTCSCTFTLTDMHVFNCLPQTGVTIAIHTLTHVHVSNFLSQTGVLMATHTHTHTHFHVSNFLSQTGLFIAVTTTSLKILEVHVSQRTPHAPSHFYL